MIITITVTAKDQLWLMHFREMVLCVYIYIYIHTHNTHINTHTHTYKHINRYTCVCVCVYIYIYIGAEHLRQRPGGAQLRDAGANTKYK